jgi:hypothetical protein
MGYARANAAERLDSAQAARPGGDEGCLDFVGDFDQASVRRAGFLSGRDFDSGVGDVSSP